MKTVALVAALTGSCAFFYFLYNMKVNTKERRSASKKNKVSDLQSDVPKNEMEKNHNSNCSLNYTDTLSSEKKYSNLSYSVDTKSLSAEDESITFSQIKSEDSLISRGETNSENLSSPSEATEIKKEIASPSSSKCHNLNDEIKVHVSSSLVDSDLPENNANMCHITLSHNVPENDKDDFQLSSPQSEHKSTIALDVNLAENNCNENISESELTTIETKVENNLSKINKNSSEDIQTSSNEPQEFTIKSEFLEPQEITVMKSESLENFDDTEKQCIKSEDQCTSLVAVKPLVPAKSKKRRQRERSHAVKAKLSNSSLEVTKELENPICTEALNLEKNKSKSDPTEKLPCKSNIKEGFWAAKETTENLETDDKHIESKMLACSPDHLCTSDLERETSQTPEHENITSDSQSLISQASFDSGQGSIDQETVFSNLTWPEGNSEYYMAYQFEVPQLLVGKLIGKKGAFLNKLKAATSTSIVVMSHNDKKYKLCSIEGKKWQVLQTLDLIREHFPCDQFPELNLTQVNTSHHPQMNRQLLEVELPPGVVLEVQASAVISTGEVWIQQPLHPTFSALQRLHQCLNLNYGDGSSTPTVPLTIPSGTVCVCQIGDQWMRCQVVEHDETQSTVCLLDVGGHFRLPFSLLRQIRVDYVSLPFQATKCYLYGIEPSNDNGWEEEGRLTLLQLSKNNIIYATIAAYSQDGIPLVNLYQRQFNQYTFINEKLVEMGHAKWISETTFTEST